MLRELQVRELALVESAQVGFGPGLNLLTGETGSGKSLIVDALGLALGARASGEMVRQGAERALAEALFDISDLPVVTELLVGIGHDAGTDLFLTREVGRRSGARVNGRLATADQLRELGRRLVGMHGQNEHQLLLDPDVQTEALDAFAGARDCRGAVAEAYADWTSARTRLTDLERMQARGRREEEYLRWQLDELRAAGLQLGEDGELTAERAVVRHAARLAELSAAALGALRRDDGLPAAASAARAASALDPRLEMLAQRLAGLEEDVNDVSRELRRYADAIDADPRRLEAIEARLARLDEVKRKYGGSLEAAIAERDRLEGQVGATSDLDAAIEAARKVSAGARERLEAAAVELTQRRVAAAGRLAMAVTAELQGLRLHGAAFQVCLQSLPEITSGGAEVGEMRFSANPGETPAPLARVASGGELSRVMLALKTVGARSDELSTLVFDEVDAGIGGEAAIQVGVRLKALGRTHQVLVVTHLAQIACFADHHLVVEKSPGAAGRNVVRVRELSGPEERAAELARMMSGAVTPKALARARELMDEAGATAAALQRASAPVY